MLKRKKKGRDTGVNSVIEGQVPPTHIRVAYKSGPVRSELVGLCDERALVTRRVRSQVENRELAGERAAKAYSLANSAYRTALVAVHSSSLRPARCLTCIFELKTPRSVKVLWPATTTSLYALYSSESDHFLEGLKVR